MRLGALGFVGVLLLAGCAYQQPGDPADAPPKSTAQLLDTYWKLTQLGDRVVPTPQGAREIHLVLHTENQRVAGFSGCNRLTGGYVLAGDSLRFDQMAGTLMACPGGSDLEKRFLAVFPRVARWEISGITLRWLDNDGGTLAAFQARDRPPAP